MNLRKLLAVLYVYRHNFHILHLNAKGCEFHTMHSKAEEYMNLMGEYTDTIAEICKRLKQNPVDFEEVLSILQNYSGKDFIIVKSSDEYSMEIFIDYVDTMFSDLLQCIEEILQGTDLNMISNVGIKAELETIHNTIDKEYRYINKQRKG